jgi:hypothetical protein
VSSKHKPRQNKSQKKEKDKNKNKKKGVLHKKKSKNKGADAKKSIIKTTLVIHLSSHNHHPNQENQTDDPESKSSIPLRADTVLL